MGEAHSLSKRSFDGMAGIPICVRSSDVRADGKPRSGSETLVSSLSRTISPAPAAISAPTVALLDHA